jgi:hypothetical protein
MSKDRAGQSVGTLSPKKCGDLVTISGTLRREVGETWDAFAAGKLQKNRLLATICQSVRSVRGMEIMLHTFWIMELHKSTNSPGQLYTKFFFSVTTLLQNVVHLRDTHP